MALLEGDRTELALAATGLAVLATSLLYYFAQSETLPFLATALLLIVPAMMISWARPPLHLAGVLVFLALFVMLRLNFSDFTLWVGDASAYAWDGIRAAEGKSDGGFFPPLAASLAGVSYVLVGIEYMPMANILLNLMASVGVYFLLRYLTGDRGVGVIVAALFALHPLSIWFSKTTFSEPSWQCLVVLVMLTFAHVSRQGLGRANLAVLCGLILVAPLSRGSAPFVFFPVLASIFVLGAPLRRKILAALALTSAFTVSLAVSLALRSPYLIGWQYSKVYDAVTPLQVWAGISLAAVAATGIAVLASRTLNERTFRFTLLGAFFAVKILAAVMLAPLRDVGILDTLISNEASFSLANFGNIGFVLASAGLLIIFWRAATGDVLSMAIAGLYCFAAAPFSLQAVSATRPHEMYLYWSRYYWGELFVVHLIAFAVAVAWLANWAVSYLAPERRRAASLVMMAMLALIAVDWGVLRRVSSNAYLSGTARIVNFIREHAQGAKGIVVIAGDEPRYFSYPVATLLNRIPDLGVPVEFRTPEAGSVSDLEGRAIVCIDTDACDEAPGLSPLAELTLPVIWHAQFGGYDSFLPRQTYWNVSLYRDREAQ